MSPPGTWEAAGPESLQPPFSYESGDEIEALTDLPDVSVEFVSPSNGTLKHEAPRIPDPLLQTDRSEVSEQRTLELLALRQQVRVLLLDRPGQDSGKLTEALYKHYHLQTPEATIPIERAALEEVRERREDLKRDCYRVDGVNGHQGMVEVTVIDVLEDAEEEQAFYRIAELQQLQVALTPLVDVRLIRRYPDGGLRTVPLPSRTGYTPRRFSSKLNTFRSLAKAATRDGGAPPTIDDVLETLHG